MRVVNRKSIFLAMLSELFVIPFAMLYSPSIVAYCFYNRSAIPDIHVLVFPDQDTMAKYLKATEWTDKVVGAVVNVWSMGGQALLKAEAIDVKPAIDMVGDKIKYLCTYYWFGQALKAIYDNTLRKAYHQIAIGDRACWNQADIRHDLGQDRITMTFLVLDARSDAANPVLFTGDLSICAAIVFQGPGKLYQAYPFIDNTGKTQWLSYPDGKKRGYTIADYVGIK